LLGGPSIHYGLSGRKNAIDTYGEFSRHSGGAWRAFAEIDAGTLFRGKLNASLQMLVNNIQTGEYDGSGNREWGFNESMPACPPGQRVRHKGRLLGLCAWKSRIGASCRTF
jgi:hypothetical protein